MSKEDWVCELCGGTGVGIRNAYKNQGEDVIGFAMEEYCKSCGVALHMIPHLLDTRRTFEEKIDKWRRKNGS
jgi:hypothetical protein